MQFYKRFLTLPAMLMAIAIVPMAHAQPGHAQDGMLGHDEECRAGTYNPLVGIWKGDLDFTTLGKSSVLVAINPGGTFTETDSVDLDGTVGTASPGYAAWKAKDCRHYTVLINKTLFNGDAKQFFKVALPGTIVLSDDGQSWTVNLKQEVFDANGNAVPSHSGTVTGTAKRVEAGSGE
jgi:hypothetical protein